MSSLPSGRTIRRERNVNLILAEPINETTRDIGENVFVHNVPEDYEVYAFYYPSAMANEQLEYKLRKFAEITGKNLFINIGRLNDPKYVKMRNTFSITNLPVIVITGTEGLAAVKTDRYFNTVYVRLDNKDLLNSPDLTIQSLERLFNLFIGGQISEAMKKAKTEQRTAIIFRMKEIIIKKLKEIANFLSDKDITVSLIEGKFELKHSGS